jgi:hypothetical protein
MSFHAVNDPWQRRKAARNNVQTRTFRRRDPQQGVFMRNMMLAIVAAGLTVPAFPSYALARDGYYHGKVWRDSHGRLRCQRSNGTTGLIVGAAGGALVGRAIDTHGERATGTILGAAAGALVGRSIDRNRYHCH